MTVDVIRASSLAGVPHGFLGRSGGVSTGALAGLNVGYGSRDEREAIDENRRRAVAAILPGADLATVHQIHSPRVVFAEHSWPIDARPHADAMVTDKPGILLGILTADCAPVLLSDPEAGVIGAAHAGWRGALSGVIEATIGAMEQLSARREKTAAAIGPCIGRESYEVGEEFAEPFLAEDESNARFFVTADSGRRHFDLPAYVVHRLIMAGVGQVEALRLDTFADESRFYSYRRATRRGEADYGRQLSAIGLPSH